MSNYTDTKIGGYTPIEKSIKQVQLSVIEDYETFFRKYFSSYVKGCKMNYNTLPDNSSYIIEVYNIENFHIHFALSFTDVFLWLSWREKYIIPVKHKYISDIEMIPNNYNYNESIVIYAHIHQKKLKGCCL